MIQRVASEVSPREEDAIVGTEEDKQAAVQRKPAAGGDGYFAPRHATDGFSQRLDARNGAGESLDAGLRSRFTPWFGRALDSVRIHRDAEAGDLSRQISARAFTSGRDVYFAPGEYQPLSQAGRRVIAHELAHVMQQQNGATGATVRRLSAPMRVTRTNVHPWRDDISGDDNEVQTDGGTPLNAWIAYSPWQTQYSYWCHGHSLGTFENFGYSLYSGDPVMEAINQEWSQVSSSAARAGDIAVWVPTYEHSCRIVSPAFANGQLDPDNTKVSSKNGERPLMVTTLANIMTVYPGTIPTVFRKR